MTTSRTLRNAADLAAAGLISASDADSLDRVGQRYALAITPLMVELIDRGDSADPIARQFVPRIEELDQRPTDRVDPIGDAVHSPVKGIVHRYPDRALLTPLLHCPVYCRFCFRRERVGGVEKGLTEAELNRAIDYLAAHPEIWEVVITGGDPLMLPPAGLSMMMARLNAIPHLQVIRLHSRVPMVDPERINAGVIAALSQSRAAIWLAVHSNHAREFSPPAILALQQLNQAGIGLLGQTVLLKGINDDVESLATLFRSMVARRIKPYYLHQLDFAPGTEHFRVDIAVGQALMAALRGRLSGLCQPTYMLDIPGGFGKAPIGPVYLEGDQIRDWQGDTHVYPAASS